jgi:hypothetical protein
MPFALHHPGGSAIFIHSKVPYLLKFLLDKARGVAHAVWAE